MKKILLMVAVVAALAGCRDRERLGAVEQHGEVDAGASPTFAPEALMHDWSGKTGCLALPGDWARWLIDGSGALDVLSLDVPGDNEASNASLEATATTTRGCESNGQDGSRLCTRRCLATTVTPVVGAPYSDTSCDKLASACSLDTCAAGPPPHPTALPSWFCTDFGEDDCTSEKGYVALPTTTYPNGGVLPDDLIAAWKASTGCAAPPADWAQWFLMDPDGAIGDVDTDEVNIDNSSAPYGDNTGSTARTVTARHCSHSCWVDGAGGTHFCQQCCTTTTVTHPGHASDVTVSCDPPCPADAACNHAMNPWPPPPPLPGTGPTDPGWFCGGSGGPGCDTVHWTHNHIEICSIDPEDCTLW